MDIKINKWTKVYIVAPAMVATGWPELLHQLAYKLKNELKHENVFMIYLPMWKFENPVHKEYENYNIPYVETIEDNENNLLIVPEVYIDFLNNYSNIKKSIWWLSVDNYYNHVWYIQSKINKIILKIFNSQNYFFFNKKLNNIPFHFVQSEYAKQHLLSKWIPEKNISYLSDYLNSDFLKIETNISKKENIISYNPKKWYKFTKKLINYVENIKKDTSIKFVPIKNMTRREVIELLQKSKLYIDFWHFPWKDRIPREAVILWNCILISKMWSWWYKEDFPIDEYFKVDDLSNIESIYKKISFVTQNYNIEIDKFSSYKEKILFEEEKFLKDIEKIFVLH